MCVKAIINQISSLLSDSMSEAKTNSITKFIQLRGSDSVFELAQKIGYQYMTDFPAVGLPIISSRTYMGYKSLIDGTADIGMASSDMPLNLEKWASKKKVEFSQTVIAYDALAVITNPSNPIKNFTLLELKEIFAGHIKDWKELGWPAGGSIQVCSHEASRGSFGTWKKFVMGQKEHVTFKANIFEDNYSLGNYITKNRNAIGYLNSTVATKIQSNIIPVNGVAPTMESISNCKYPVCQELRLLTRNNSNEQIKHFVSYRLASDKGQSIIRKMGIATPE